MQLSCMPSKVFRLKGRQEWQASRPFICNHLPNSAEHQLVMALQWDI
jgi:hypothetical protein